MSHAIPYLLNFLNNMERLDLPILALKVTDFILNPIYSFEENYLSLNKRGQKMLIECLAQLKLRISVNIKEILRS